jgi:uncharacterized protein YciI
MFLILLRYTRPLQDVELLLTAHRQFLSDYYSSGHFLMSGGMQPRHGGVILAALQDRAEAQAIIARDPFFIEGVAHHEIIEFTPTATADGFASLIEQL